MSKHDGIHVRLDADQRAALDRAATRGNKTCSEVVRDLIMGVEITSDLKRAQADEARAIRIAIETAVESLRRELRQELLDLRADLRDDMKKSVTVAVEAATGKKVVTTGGSK